MLFARVLFSAFAFASAQVFDVPPRNAFRNQQIRHSLRLWPLHRNFLQAERLFTARQRADGSTSGAKSFQLFCRLVRINVKSFDS